MAFHLSTLSSDEKIYTISLLSSLGRGHMNNLKSSLSKDIRFDRSSNRYRPIEVTTSYPCIFRWSTVGRGVENLTRNARSSYDF